MLKIEKQAKAIKITEVKESNYKGQFIVEPLYRGYGNTFRKCTKKSLTFIYTWSSNKRYEN